MRFLINVSSGIIHMHPHPAAFGRASYGLSKSAGTLYVQLLANQYPVEKLQIVSFHPGAVWNDAYGIPQDALPLDNGSCSTIV
jgi:NAD(P)-dependent dehydrogenase (short-subunit alcohol dehydrogenase family)